MRRNSSRYRWLILGFLLFFGLNNSAVSAQEKRLALVVTNQTYVNKAVGPLRFSTSDGEIVSAALIKLGFNVRILQEGTKAQFTQSFQEFVDDVKSAGPQGISFFYFSGHAWDDTHANYIILDEKLPPEAGRAKSGKAEEWSIKALPIIGVPIRMITKAMGGVDSRATFVVINSHLNIPEPALIDEALKPDQSGRKSNGIILAAQGRPGLIAWDTNDFSKALAGALLTPAIDATGVFKQVQVKVAEATNGRNVPWVEDRLLTSFKFVEEVPQQVSPESTQRGAASRAIDDGRLELAFWDAVKDSTDPRMLDAYLAKFPNGNLAAVARLKIEDLQKKRPAPQADAQKMPANLRRVALVIGNSNYPSVGVLKNPGNDARSVARNLRDLGFAEVQEHTDLGKQAMLKALKSFGEAAENADWAVVYFAGHGMEVKGTNYLIPTDASLAKEEDADDEAVPVARIIDRMSGSAAIKIVILDACRNNPFGARMVRRGGTRSGVFLGLGEMKADSGTLIAYAAAPGKVALDGATDNSPYANALVQNFGEAGLDIRLFFSKVRDGVLEASRNQQEPWYSSALPGKQLVFKLN